MALYEFRCKTCDDRFEVRRPMAEANVPAPCPQGHTNTVRVLSNFGMMSTGSASPSPAPVMAGGGGGCCGGGCGCH